MRAVLFILSLVCLNSISAFVPHIAPLKSSGVSWLNMATATSFDLDTYLKSKKAVVEVALDKSLTATTPRVENIIESMKYSLMAGGKRIRPVICLAACEMFGGNDDMAMPTAVALEMIHTMSLIHDDLPSMDNDDLRRGKPTNHVLYGEDIAILAGDALLSTSFEHVARETKDVPADRVVQVLLRLGTSVGAYGLAGGQVQDLMCENKDDTSLQDLEWIHLHKTAALLKVSATSGAILAGATDEDIKNLEVYAEKIGLAFQIADDILDVTATSEELGKTAGKDEEVNKTTYVKLLGLEESKKEAAKIIDEAKAALSKYGDKAAPLLGIADYIVARKN